jgi:hypothetical protein
MGRELAEQERQFEEEFRTALSEKIASHKSGSVSFESIHFPEMPWNQQPWREILEQNYVDFSMAVFEQPANLSGIAFGPQARFNRTVFRSTVTFDRSSFLDGTEFVEAVFEADANFSGTRLAGWVNFAQARFLAKAKFGWAKMHGRIWFKGGVDNPVFGDEAEFTRLELSPGAEVRFESVSLAKASFLHSNIEPLGFTGVQWNHDSAARRGRMSRRRVLWDETSRDLRGSDPVTLEALAENYRQLVLNSERKRDFDAAEDFHIGEMEMRRIAYEVARPGKLARLLRRLNAFRVYRLLSIYGSDYWRAAWVLLLMVLLAALAFLFAGLRDTPSQPGASQSIIQYRFPARGGEPIATASQFFRDYPKALVHTLSILTFQRQRPFNPLGWPSHALEALFTILFTGQSALLLLAIRRRFKR